MSISEDTEVVLLRNGSEFGRWPFITPSQLDLRVVDELARLQVAARRLGCSILVRHPGVELLALLSLTGLAEELVDSESGQV